MVALRPTSKSQSHGKAPAATTRTVTASAPGSVVTVTNSRETVIVVDPTPSPDRSLDISSRKVDPSRTTLTTVPSPTPTPGLTGNEMGMKNGTGDWLPITAKDESMIKESWKNNTWEKADKQRRDLFIIMCCIMAIGVVCVWACGLVASCWQNGLPCSGKRKSKKTRRRQWLLPENVRKGEMIRRMLQAEDDGEELLGGGAGSAEWSERSGEGKSRSS